LLQFNSSLAIDGAENHFPRFGSMSEMMRLPKLYDEEDVTGRAIEPVNDKHKCLAFILHREQA
jgi:hypothetical protein